MPQPRHNAIAKAIRNAFSNKPSMEERIQAFNEDENNTQNIKNVLDVSSLSSLISQDKENENAIRDIYNIPYEDKKNNSEKVIEAYCALAVLKNNLSQNSPAIKLYRQQMQALEKIYPNGKKELPIKAKQRLDQKAEAVKANKQMQAAAVKKGAADTKRTHKIQAEWGSNNLDKMINEYSKANPTERQNIIQRLEERIQSEQKGDMANDRQYIEAVHFFKNSFINSIEQIKETKAKEAKEKELPKTEEKKQENIEPIPSVITGEDFKKTNEIWQENAQFLVKDVTENQWTVENFEEEVKKYSQAPLAERVSLRNLVNNKINTTLSLNNDNDVYCKYLEAFRSDFEKKANSLDLSSVLKMNSLESDYAQLNGPKPAVPGNGMLHSLNLHTTNSSTATHFPSETGAKALAKLKSDLSSLEQQPLDHIDKLVQIYAVLEQTKNESPEGSAIQKLCEQKMQAIVTVAPKDNIPQRASKWSAEQKNDQKIENVHEAKMS